VTRWVIRNFDTNGAVEALLNAASTTAATLASCVAPAPTEVPRNDLAVVS
jgi:hypothetical protein